MDSDADVALLADVRLARVEPDPNLDCRIVRPRVILQRLLPRNSRRDGIAGARERDEERIALRVDLLPSGVREHLAEQPLMIGEDDPVTISERGQQAG